MSTRPHHKKRWKSLHAPKKTSAPWLFRCQIYLELETRVLVMALAAFSAHIESEPIGKCDPFNDSPQYCSLFEKERDSYELVLAEREEGKMILLWKNSKIFLLVLCYYGHKIWCWCQPSWGSWISISIKWTTPCINMYMYMKREAVLISPPSLHVLPDLLTLLQHRPLIANWLFPYF